MESLEGRLLIASPKLKDPRFDRSVILLLHHDEHGAMGIVLNRPMSTNQQAPWQLLDLIAKEGSGTVQIGGPVSGPLIVLRSMPSSERQSERQSEKGGVFVVEQQDQLERLVKHSGSDLRFFVGHAGWSSGQLESEIAEGSWLTTEARPEFVFEEHKDMWVAAIRESGRSFYRDVLGIHSFPKHASSN